MTTYHVVNLDEDIDIADDVFELKSINNDELRVYNQNHEYMFVVDLMKHRDSVEFRETVLGSGFSEIIILIHESVISGHFITFIKKIFYQLNAHR